MTVPNKKACVPTCCLVPPAHLWVLTEMFLLQLTGLKLVSAFHESIRMNYNNFEGTVGGFGSKLMYELVLQAN